MIIERVGLVEGEEPIILEVDNFPGITFEDGAVQQSNYYDYDVVRSDNYPTVVTHIVPHPFSVHATGVGEPGVPPVSPAIANGLFAATGERRRHLPMGVDA